MPKQKPIDPELLRETPPPTTYNLTMYQSGGSSAQDIELSREEFIDLKDHLTSMRGPARRIDESQAYISQREIGVLLDLESMVTTLAANLRRRLYIGAAVEKGELQIDAEIEDGKFLETFPELESSRSIGLNHCESEVSIQRVKTA
jgi:hypothetical protein